MTLTISRERPIDVESTSSFSDTGQRLKDYTCDVLINYYQASITSIPLETQFKQLADQWEEQTINLSDLERMYAHPYYQKIIGMGEDAISFILERISTNPDYWDRALESITRINPVPPESRGNLKESVAYWLEWGEENGYFYS